MQNQNVKTLMMLHGWGMNSHVWEPIRNALESEFHVLWVDLPGHGVNCHLNAQSLENMVDLIADVTPNNTHIIGWSLGGMVAQALAQKIPEQINSLTMVTSTPRFSQSVNTNDGNEWLHAMTDEVLTRFAENLKKDTKKTIKGFIALQFIGVNDAKPAQDALIKHILGDTRSSSSKTDSALKADKKWGGVNLANANVVSNTDVESKSNIPTQEALDVGLQILKHADLRSNKPSCAEHWILSEYDRLIPKGVINDLISLRSDAQITLLEKAGHAPFITHPELFLKHVNQFIDAQP